MADTGFKLPTVAAQLDYNAGALWSSDTNIFTDSDVTFTSSDPTSNQYTDKLFGSAYDFSAISNADIINGIEIEVRADIEDVTKPIEENIIQLSQGTTLVGTNKSTGVDYSDVWTTYTYGGPTDMWGTTLTASDIKNSNFGICLAFFRTNTGTRNIYVNTMRIKIYYEASGQLSFPLTMSAF